MDTDTLRCFECGSKMIEDDHHGVTLDRCRACGGLWFDVDEIYAYLRAHPALVSDHEPTEVDFKRCTNGVGAKCSCCGHDAVEFGDFRGISYQRCTWCGGLFIGRRQVREIVASQAGQVTTWGPEGAFNTASAMAGGATVAVVSGTEQDRSAGERLVDGLAHVAEGGFEVGAHAVLEGGGEIAGAALELVLEIVLGIVAGALGG